MSLRMSVTGPVAIVIGLAWMGAPPHECRAEATTAGNLQEVLRSAAEGVLKVTRDQPVSIGQFTPTGLPDANGGPAIGELLKEQFEALQPGIVRRAAAF